MTRAEQALCAAASGTYNATFTLRESEGDCGEAKDKSHDPIAFDDEGQFVSPAPGFVTCKTVHEGCDLAVSCATSFSTAKALLNATLSEDGSSVTGTAVVEGSYKGCKRVVYDVAAVRKAPMAE